MHRVYPSSVLITGASSGLGAALARHYAGAGKTLFLHGRDADRLDAIARTCRIKGAKVFTAALDVRDRTAIKTWVLECDDVTPLDLVIANAGISAGTGVDGETSEQAEAIFDTNMTGALNTLHPALSRMAQRQSGQIALISSLSSYSGWPGAPAYSASKAALRFYAEALNAVWAGRNIHICAVSPGFIRTPLTDINPFPMPFLMEADQAAAFIAKKLEKRPNQIVFPLPVRAAAVFLGLLPLGARLMILKNMPTKPGKS